MLLSSVEKKIHSHSMLIYTTCVSEHPHHELCDTFIHICTHTDTHTHTHTHKHTQDEFDFDRGRFFLFSPDAGKNDSAG
jgi:hypothetical protein